MQAYELFRRLILGSFGALGFPVLAGRKLLVATALRRAEIRVQGLRFGVVLGLGLGEDRVQD